ncbi:MAG: bifunctional nuclease family protein [Candidatus Hydromicrobium sp.]|nr:bifunctional nuclease family protein [Chloroflexota bacterium]MDP3011240.1 bifunctional nuclease family protein [Candidatus Hydromicrobium sp.]
MKNKKNSNLIKMTLEGVRIELPSQKPILLLKEENGNRYLPIWIGPFEASAIALEMSNIKTPRPMTHDLIINIINNLKISIDNIEITDIRDNTFYAIINIKNTDRKVVRVDSRPSDAIATAVRSKCDIYVAEHVLESGGLRIQTIEEEVKIFKSFLDHVEPEDFKDK